MSAFVALINWLAWLFVVLVSTNISARWILQRLGIEVEVTVLHTNEEWRT